MFDSIVESKMTENEMPRAKRLKLLREAKARKEGKCDKGESKEIVVGDSKTDEEETQPTDQNIVDTPRVDLVERVTQAQQEDTKKDDESDDDLLNLAPKRANWDIERDIAPRLRKLERRTQHAIVEILREKLALEQEEEGSDRNEDSEPVEPVK